MSTERARRRFMQRTSSPAANFSFIDFSGIAVLPPLTELVRTAVERRMRLLQTIYRKIAAVDPVGPWRGGEHDHIRDLLGGAEPTHRKAVPHVVVEIFRIGEAVAVPAIAIDQYRAGRHRVDADA